MTVLLAIDGLNILRRVYEANPEPDSEEKAELALRNAFFSFRKLLDAHAPSHVLPAFDAGGPTWRNAIHPPYRAGRAPMPAVLSARLPAFLEQLQRLGLHPVRIDGVEADDVIATAVLRWLRESRGEAVVVSTDHDLLSLVAHGARLWDHFKSEWRDRAWVERKYGVPPEKLVELFALVGDAADGIPGIPHIGQKTAAKLLQTCADLEAVMAGAGILLTPLGQRLRAGREAAFLSRELVRLKTDVQLGVSWNMLRYAPA